MAMGVLNPLSTNSVTFHYSLLVYRALSPSHSKTLTADAAAVDNSADSAAVSADSTSASPPAAAFATSTAKRNMSTARLTTLV